MWPLPRPLYKAYDFYQASVLSTRSKELSDRLLPTTPTDPGKQGASLTCW